MFAGLSNSEVGMALIRHEAGRVVLPAYMVEELKVEIEKRKAAKRRAH